jgi:hypothetical protein
VKHERRPTRAVCVTGMHRCGTSVAARAIELLGVSLGDHDRLLPPGSDNPAGYWENRFVKELNDELLARLGGAWDQPPVLDPGWERDPGLDPFRSRAADILADAFGPPDRWPKLIGWKDPRLCLLLPFWQTVTPIATTIVMVRDPVEVARSLALRRQRVDTPQAALLWLRYLLAATANDPGHLMVRQNDFFVDLPGTLAALARHLDLPAPDEDVEATVRDHLDPALRHHVASSPRDGIDNPLLALAVAVWADGAVDLGVVPEVIAEPIRRGWFRAPIDSELLAEARAQVVDLTQRLQRRWRAEIEATEH